MQNRFDKITILILHFNRSHTLFQCVASIRENTRWPYHILIRDHKSESFHKEHIRRLAGADCEIQFHDEHFSCGGGRRDALSDIKTDRVVFLDDDIKVSPSWLTTLATIHNEKHASCVAANLISDVNAGPDFGQHYKLSGIRWIEYGEVTKAPFQYMGDGPLCHGGATLYRTDDLRSTEWRPAFEAGFEDWDQILQISQDQCGTIWGSNTVLFHNHKDESKLAGYWDRRWKWIETLEAAIAAFDHWGIKTGVRNTYFELIRREITIPKPLLKRIEEIDVMARTQSFRMPEGIEHKAIKAL